MTNDGLPEPRLRFEKGTTFIEGKARIVYEKGDPLYTADQMQAYARAAIAQERERCALIADDEARIREEAGRIHPEDSEARGRCFAAARAAANVAKGVRSGEVVEPRQAEGERG